MPNYASDFDDDYDSEGDEFDEEYEENDEGGILLDPTLSAVDKLSSLPNVPPIPFSAGTDADEPQEIQNETEFNKVLGVIDYAQPNWDGLAADEPDSPPHTRAAGRRSGAAPKLSPETRNKLGEANLKYVTREFPEAMRLLEEIIQADPTIRSAWHTLSTIHAELGHQEREIKCRIVAAHLTPNASEEWKSLAALAKSIQQEAQALYCLSQAVKIDKKDVGALWDKALLLKQLGHSRDAINNFNSLLKLHPHDPNVLLEMIPLLASSGDNIRIVSLLTEALEHFKTVIPFPSTEQIESRECIGFEEVLKLVNYLAFARRWSSIIEIVHTATRWLQGRIEERFWDNYNDDREFDSQRCERPDADAKLEQVSDVNPLPLELRSALGRARLALGSVTEAKKMFAMVLSTSATDVPNLYEEIADAYMSRSMWEDSLDILQILAENEEARETMYVTLFEKMGDCYKKLNNMESAITCYKNVTVIDESCDTVKLKLAECHEQAGDKAQALAIVREVIESSQAANLLEKTIPAPTINQRPQSGLVNIEPQRPSDRKRAAMSAREHLKLYEAEKEIEAKSTWLKLLQIEEDIDGNEQEWIELASPLIEGFRETRQLFPYDRKKVFTGVVYSGHYGLGRQKGQLKLANLKTRAQSLEGRLQRSLGDAEAMDESEIDFESSRAFDFRGLDFTQWMSLFVKFAHYLTLTDDYETAEEVLRVSLNASIFHSSRIQQTIKLCLLSCATRAGCVETVVEMWRFFTVSHQFVSDALLIGTSALSAINGSFEGFISAKSQKFIHRETRTMEAVVKGRPYRFNKDTNRFTIQTSVAHREMMRERKQRLISDNDNDGHDDEDEDSENTGEESDESSTSHEKPQETAHTEFEPPYVNPVFLATHGQIMQGAKSAQSAIFYLLRAYDRQPNDPVLVLNLGCAYLYRSMQRQADNRHHMIGQAFAFFGKYRALRGPGAETEYNFGRAFHQLSLFHLAVHHYEEVLRMAEVTPENPRTFAKESAFNLISILVLTGATDVAKGLAERWLAV